MNLRQLLVILLLTVSCKAAQINDIDQSNTAEKTFSTVADVDSIPLAEFHPIKDYRSSNSRIFDLLHTKLELKFEWEKQAVIGKASLKLAPYFYPGDVLILDAKSLKIESLYLIDNVSQKQLEYEIISDKLYIELGKVYAKNEEINIVIEYTAYPNERKINGSEAITSDKGLYFINPDGSEPKPVQIWTQGETTANSAWFPTIDSPNERCTQEVYLTVPDSMTTLSNGLKISTVNNNDGTKTDYWKMDQPHAPYLFMIAVGNFVEVKDKWKNIPIGYYVEPEYEATAKEIFGNTPEMMEFFSNKLQYPFPWPQYNQIVVRDFVSGAMENTTASVFMEELQLTKKELIDENWDYIIAHELFHHWFGDLVTCESWSNLPLNESFADFSEQLWISHKYGDDEGDYHGLISLENYLAEAEEELKPMIRFYFDDKEDMFDRHSYEKGGGILQMLKTYLGDEAFFGGLNIYLKENAYQSVEIHQLRLAFEKITGEDLNWFFNQWFLSAGHPVLSIQELYQNDTLVLNIKQIQNLEESPLFKLPVYIEVFQNNKSERYPLLMQSLSEEIKIPLSSKPDLVIFDADQELVGEIYHEKTPGQLLFQLENAEKLVARYQAFEQIAEIEDVEVMKEAIDIALDDSSYRLKVLALDFLQSAPDYLADKSLLDKVLNLIVHDKSEIRAGSLYALIEFNPNEYRKEILKAVNDSSYSVQGVALEGVLLLDSLELESIFLNFIPETQIDVLLPTANFVNQTGEDKYFDWYQSRLKTLRSGNLFYFIQYYAEFIISSDKILQEQSVPLLIKIASDAEINYTRYTAYQILYLLNETLEIDKVLESIRKNERDTELKQLYDQL